MKYGIAQGIRPATIGQIKDIGATLIQAIPPGLTFETASWILGHKSKLQAHTQEFFLNSMSRVDPVRQWQSFYQKAFGLKVGLSYVEIPERTEEQKKEFTRLVVILKCLTNNQVYDACAKHFPCSRYTEDLDSGVPTSERDPKNGTYAIWVRDVVEADEVHKKNSANMIKGLGIKTETLLERMLHGLKYFLETGRHLDITNCTLCSGSRYSDGGVPDGYWDGGEFGVRWGDADSGGLRSREVVSCLIPRDLFR